MNNTTSGLLISGALHATLIICIVSFDQKKEFTKTLATISLNSFNLEKSITKHQEQPKKEQSKSVNKKVGSAKKQQPEPNKVEEKDNKKTTDTEIQKGLTNESSKSADVPSKPTQTQENYTKHLPVDENEEYIKLNKAKVREAIAKYQVYPPLAKKLGLEGICVISFKLYPNGGINETKIIKSSGFSILDKSALKSLEDAAPELPKPNKPVVIIIPIEYVIR